MGYYDYYSGFAPYISVAEHKAKAKKYIAEQHKIEPGEVHSLVQGSGKKPYTVKVRIDELTEEQYEKIVEKCALKIQNLEDLINGNFPDDLKSLFTEKRAGLFPSMAKIHFNCSCPDWADMCKHVAAVLYGIGSRFDRLIWNGSVNCCGKWVKDNSAVRYFHFTGLLQGV